MKNSKVAYRLFLLDARQGLLETLIKAQKENDGKAVRFEDLQRRSGYKSETRLNWHLIQLEMNGFVKRDGEGHLYSTTMNSEASDALKQYQKLIKTVQSMPDYK